MVGVDRIEPDHLAVMKHGECIDGQVGFADRFGEFLWRLVERFVAQFEGAPLNADGFFRVHVLENLHGLLRVNVPRSHQPARRIRANGNQREIEAAEYRADPFEIA